MAKITNEDNLRMEVLTLKLEKAQLLKNVYSEKAAKATQDEQEVLLALENMRQEFAKTYDVPVDRFRVGKDGTIVILPLTAVAAPPAPPANGAEA